MRIVLISTSFATVARSADKIPEKRFYDFPFPPTHGKVIVVSKPQSASQTPSSRRLGMTKRERSVQTARLKLTDERLTAFLRAVAHDVNVLAVALVNERLDAGEGLDEIFYDGEEFGYSLIVTQVARTVFQIEFGCQVDPLAGDGGVWNVVFNAKGHVLSVESPSYWIS